VITSSINRAAHRGTSIESEFLRKDQFSAFNNSNIDNTIASYNLNPEAWKVIATAYLDGTFAATYGLDTINPLDKVDHYRVPGLSSSASDTWAANMKTIGVLIAVISPTTGGTSRVIQIWGKMLISLIS